MRTVPPLVLALVLLASLAAPASGQRRRADAPPARTFVGGALHAAVPVGEFRDYVDSGFGLSAHLLHAVEPSGTLGLRLDGGFVNYGNERRQVLLSPTIGGRITVDLNTSNNILLLGAGPQLMVPDGRFRPYLFGTAGLAYFVTESSLRGNRGGDDFANTTNHDDLTFALGGGAGVYVPVRRGSRPISVDAGARYHRNGRATYLRQGDIRDNPDGTITIFPVESEADLITFHVGVSAAVGPRR